MDPYVSVLALAPGAGWDLLLFGFTCGAFLCVSLLWSEVNFLKKRVAVLEVNGDSEEEDGEIA